MHKILIGLTGKYCAGKNHVALLIEKRGIPVLDVDKLGHLVIEMEKERLVARFGGGILGKDGLVDRKALGAKVFGRPEELAALEGIVHPGANRETLAWIKCQKGKVCVINAALLHRSIVFDELDAILLVEAPFITRLLRAKERDHLPWPALIKRFQSQSKFNSQYFKGETDIYRVYNPLGYKISGKRLENRIDEILSLLGIK